jgi:hypothetical protein
LSEPAIRVALKQAWHDSQPGLFGGHEEGGFILRDIAGNFKVVRWPQGQQNQITVPAHSQCRIGSADIVATFHTHPNTGSGYLQEPSETDKRAIRDDPDLKGHLYVGEFVISETVVYLISPTGGVNEIGLTSDVLGPI